MVCDFYWRPAMNIIFNVKLIGIKNQRLKESLKIVALMKSVVENLL